MPLIADTRRWMRDQFTQDELVQESGSPKKRIAELSQNLNNMLPADRVKELSRIQNYATYYYVGHQREQRVPSDIQQALSKIERETVRLNMVDHARQKLMELGGPPTAETVLASIDRSAKERTKEMSMRISISTGDEQSVKHKQGVQKLVANTKAQAQVIGNGVAP